LGNTPDLGIYLLKISDVRDKVVNMSQSMKQILLVEDELETRLVIHLMLHLRQYEVDFAEDGQAAVKMANNKEYDCILMDIGLPKMSGIDACLAIRHNEVQKIAIKRNAYYCYF
ncbi:response regulator, partial [Legionella tunisiensis]|uniref:response regulator n=1 Tax=Legionella tunisiensis TaxID=1034944 RepID=UPI0005949792